MWKNLLILCLAAAAAFFGWRLYGGALPAGAQETAVVISARADLAPGTVLTEDMLETRTLPRYALQQGAYEVKSMTDIKAPAGLTAVVRIPKGDQVTENCLKDDGAKPSSAAADKLLQAQERYLSGLKYFQNSNYPMARSEWQEALKLSPKNADAAAGLKRIAMIEAGGK
ncbi:MAG: SAF domain-containing protein [Elusimicrobiales bacterium]|nr:SAF domain-containing protein [Elusimicrobiales bacterium]